MNFKRFRNNISQLPKLFSLLSAELLALMYLDLDISFSVIFLLGFSFYLEKVLTKRMKYSIIFIYIAEAKC